ncbi:MAG TPA: hypothetical protein VHE34_09490 [Puia sp.]|uniref:hypothetical protein n=1 Tax=Puia sp. TaxID=2045100 RepID=UPI002BE478A1|nr:hypothetical protein [Puia sp.]HVU95447.1 hypothetical protein [Puia sp.]
MTATQGPFWGYFILLLGTIVFLDQKYGMLRDSSTARKKPYSWARVQLAWWTIIILASFFAILTLGHGIPTFNQSTLILLGISAATTGAARIIDQSDQQKTDIVLAQNMPGQGFFLDILSDGTGPNLHRFQTVLFNLAFGIWFISQVAAGLTPACTSLDCINKIMPALEQNNLILLGLSAGTYAALKTTENKPAPGSMPDKVPDTSGHTGQLPAQG